LKVFIRPMGLRVVPEHDLDIDPAGAAVVPRRIRASWRNSCDAATAPLFTYLAPSDVLMKRW